MLRIGCHLSSSKGYLNMGKTAVEIGANTFQFFTRNPRGGSAKPLNVEDMRNYCAYAEEHGIAHILAHAPYTLNACAADEGLRTFARETMADDLQRFDASHPNAFSRDGITSTSDDTLSRICCSCGPNTTKGTGLRVCPRSPMASMFPWSEVITSVIPAASAR